ncbi:hypothetical protein Amn_29370 [Aminobacter sp. Y103A]|nr:hypothetical protein Amn_29370 [Aminobacter sp. SS-2016]
MPEWLKGTDCKSVDSVYVGSNPTSSTTAGPDAIKRCLKGWFHLLDAMRGKEYQGVLRS